MAEHVVKEVHDLKGWKGSPEEMADLFGRALQLAREASPNTEDMSLSITVSISTGEINFKDLNEFRAYGWDRCLAEVEEVIAHVSGWDGDLRVMFMFRGKYEMFSGASVSVSGTNHVAVSGLAKQLGQQLDKGGRHKPRNWVVSLWLLLIAVSLAFAAAMVSGAASWILLGLALLAALGCATVDFVMPRIVPGLEILDPKDPKSRYERWRTKFLAACGALLLVVIGAVLQAIL